MAIPKKLRNIIDYTTTYVGKSSKDWFRIKAEIINQFPPKERSRFSRRHYSTKKHILNSFDKEVIEYWESKVGVELWIDPKKLHPENWEQKPHGWALIKLNNERSKNKKESQKTSKTD